MANTFQIKKELKHYRGFPGGSEVKASACNAGDPGSIPGLGSSPGEGNGNPFQYSCLENLMERIPKRMESLEKENLLKG